MEGLKQQIEAIALSARADGDFAKRAIEKVYGAVLGDVQEHHGKIRASFVRQSKPSDGNLWKVIGVGVLVLSVSFLFYAVGNIGGRSNGGIHRATIK